MKIQIRKFKRLSDLTVNVPAKITGGNEKGKTTILEAISFCLTGKDLSGNEFKQVYDNRVDLHDAIADVSYFDSYGNEYRRTVSPVFQINKMGENKVKTLRNTTCQKNGIEVKDFANEFSDFKELGTDWFFRQRENDQRECFLKLFQNKLPDFDLTKKNKELSELKKNQKNRINRIKKCNEYIELYTFNENIPVWHENGKDAIIDYLNYFKNNWIETKKIDQTELFNIDAKIVKLQNEISGYFSNLKDIVEAEFSGKIKIGVELQEYVISRDEYKDVFKITADSKIFPYECNGALQNNTKLQILASLQRLAGYVGITIMDNIEANTTQEIDSCGLNLVSAQATFDKELKIS